MSVSETEESVGIPDGGLRSLSRICAALSFEPTCVRSFPTVALPSLPMRWQAVHPNSATGVDGPLEPPPPPLSPQPPRAIARVSARGTAQGADNRDGRRTLHVLPHPPDGRPNTVSAVSEKDLTDAINSVLSVLAILLEVLVGMVALLALVALVWRPARAWLAEARDTLFGQELWIAAAIAIVSTLGSLYYSEIADYIPCRLCWYQRIFMYPMAIVLTLAALRRDVRGGALYALLFPILGAGVSAYHIYIEHHPEAETAGCKIGAPCSVKWFEKFGYVTIPVLALSAFAAIFTLLVFALSRTGIRDRPGASA